MRFLEHLRERQKDMMQHRQEWAACVREQWVRCRVSVYGPGLAMRAVAEGAMVYLGDESGQWVHGEVVEVNDYGGVRIAYAVGSRGEVYYTQTCLEALGKTCVRNV